MNTFTGTGAGLSGFKPLGSAPSSTAHPSFQDVQHESYRFANEQASRRQQNHPQAALMGYIPAHYAAFNGQQVQSNPFTIHGTSYASRWEQSGRSYRFGVAQNSNPFAGGMSNGQHQQGSKH